jgi:methionyl-tRNA formyltransferase
MRILYFGTSAFAIPALRALLDQAYTVVGVVSQPDRPAGRGGQLTPPPIKPVANAAGVPVLQPESCRTPEFLDIARALAPDLSVVAAYGQFLPDPLRTLPPLGTVNLHGSLLPKYRGAAPIQRALWNGEPTVGVCLMWMAREMDAGDVIACSDTPITEEDTGGTLVSRLADLGARLLLDWLPAISAGTAPHVPQDPAGVTFAPVIRKDERLVDWTQPAVAIWRQIRALAPSPSATTVFRGQPVKLLAARPLNVDTTTEPGTIVDIDARHGLHAATGAGLLEIIQLQPASKRPMSGEEFLRGIRPSPGEQFG